MAMQYASEAAGQLSLASQGKWHDKNSGVVKGCYEPLVADDKNPVQHFERIVIDTIVFMPTAPSPLETDSERLSGPSGSTTMADRCEFLSNDDLTKESADFVVDAANGFVCCKVFARERLALSPSNISTMYDRHYLEQSCLDLGPAQRRECIFCRHTCIDHEGEHSLIRASGPVRDERRLLHIRAFLGAFYTDSRMSQYHEATISFVERILMLLRRRARDFQRYSYVNDDRFCHPYEVTVFPQTATRRDQISTSLDSVESNLRLWAWWWQAFSRDNDPESYSVINHPMASTLLLETMGALRQWDRWHMSPSMVFDTLMIRLRHVIEQSRLPKASEDWDNYLHDLVLVASHANVGHGERWVVDASDYRSEDHPILSRI